MKSNFYDDLDYANKKRELLDAQYYSRFAKNGQFVPLDRSAGSLWIQRNAHVDCVVLSQTGGSVTVEEKIVRWPGYPYTSITIETHSNLERTSGEELGDGWIQTSVADYLLYSFEQEDKGQRVWLYRLPKLREWFIDNYKRYKITDTKNEHYTTRCRIVPLADIPKACTQHKELLISFS